MLRGMVPPVVFLFLALCFRFSEGIHCWECNSRYDRNCGDPFKNSTLALTDCSQRSLLENMTLPATICRKITQKVQSETRIIRSCGFFNPQDAGTCISRAGTHLVFVHYCQCAGDGCNTASSLLQHPFIPILMHFFILAFVLS